MFIGYSTYYRLAGDHLHDAFQTHGHGSSKGDGKGLLRSLHDLSSHGQTIMHMCMYEMFFFFFFRNTILLSSGRGSFRTLSAAGHAGGPPVHHGESVGHGRAPWRVLWAFTVAKSVKVPRDRCPPSWSRPGPWKPPKRIFLL